MREIVMRLDVDPSGYESTKEIIEDVVTTLVNRGHRVDGALFSVTTRIAYAWREDGKKRTAGPVQRTDKGDLQA
jgi:hypothetical protein